MWGNSPLAPYDKAGVRKEMVEFRVKTYQRLGPRTVVLAEGRENILRLPERRGMPGSRRVRYSNHEREGRGGRRDPISMDDGWKGERRVASVVGAPSPLRRNLIVRSRGNQTTVRGYPTRSRLRIEERPNRNKVEGGVASNAPTKATRRKSQGYPTRGGVREEGGIALDSVDTKEIGR